MHKRLHKVLSLAMAALLFITSTFANANQSYAAKAIKDGDVYATAYAMTELSNVGKWGYTIEPSEVEGGIYLFFSQQYAEAAFVVPEEVVEAGLLGYRVFASNDSMLAVKIYDDAEEIAVSYHSSSVSLEDTSKVPSQIGLMSLAEDGEYGIAGMWTELCARR